MPLTKDEILAEIRRTAEENGGRPLGRRRFFTETGIAPTDWAGTLWARSDALHETGYEPNRLNSAIDESLLLEKYIEFTRELGRFPAKLELRLKRISDSQFPSHNTFSRFGGKADLVHRLVGYCHGRSGYEDIVGLCERFTPIGSRRETDPIEPEREWGPVYLIKAGRHHKIGRTNAIGRRERELAIQLPDRSETVHVIRTDDPAGVEAYWHRRFETSRKNGEWFELKPADIAAFKRRRFM